MAGSWHILPILKCKCAAYLCCLWRNAGCQILGGHINAVCGRQCQREWIAPGYSAEHKSDEDSNTPGETV